MKVGIFGGRFKVFGKVLKGEMSTERHDQLLLLGYVKLLLTQFVALLSHRKGQEIHGVCFKAI